MDIGTPDAVRPFRDWQDAVAALRAAEHRADAHEDILRLSGDVIRTRNALTAEPLGAGREAPDDVLRHLTRDDDLLNEPDDARSGARLWAMPRPRAVE